MQVRNNTIFMGDDAARSRAAANGTGEKASAKSTQGKSIKAASFNERMDPIASRKNLAKKQAMRIIKESLSSDTSIDTSVGDRRKKIKELTDEIGEHNKNIKTLEDERAALRTRYGVEEDSEEEQELQLLAKEEESKFAGSKVTLTDDEKTKLKEIKEKYKETEMTEYQSRSLELKKSEKQYADKIYSAERQISVENAIISGTKLERLKSNPMLVARKRADAVMEQANDEVMAMLIEEGKEHIDETLDEKMEAAKEKREKEKELEERIEKIKDKKEEEKEFTEDILEATTEQQVGEADMSGAQEQVKEMMNKLKLLEEDIKGAAVDAEV